MLTVVEEMEPGNPRSWNEAAAICVSEIFDEIGGPLGHLRKVEENGKNRIVSSSGPAAEIENSLNSVLEGLSIIDNQFEGMVQSREWFPSDQMCWVEEWKNLGSIAAAAGIKNGNLFNIHQGPGGHPENLISSASAAASLDSWMLREDITSTLIRKQSDYGHHNIARFGRHGLVVRCHDKIARLKNLHLARGGQAANESLTDTYTDIVGYSAIGMMWERGWFLLDLTRD
jgi:hypothetical protein